MKTTLQPQIDVINVTERNTELGKVFTVDYWDENFDGENNVSMEISEEALFNFVEEHYGSPESEGMNSSDADYWFTENRDEIIKDFIIANS